MTKQFLTGIVLGRKHHAKIVAKSDRWKRRNIPVFIRENLLVPYYVSENNGFFELYVIQYPVDASDKVAFVPFARSAIDEEKFTEVFARDE